MPVIRKARTQTKQEPETERLVSRSGVPEPPPGVQVQLDDGKTSLAGYTRELVSILELESQKSWDLAAANRQLEVEVRALKTSADVLVRRTEELEDAYIDTVVRLTKASEYKDPESGAHIVRMSHYAEALALHLDMGREFASLIHAAAPMHDVGKIGIPDTILMKKGPLDAEEWELMKTHPTIGAELLEGSKSPLLELARQIALTHHERWDGSGYPAGLKGEEIPIAGRIVMLADCYDNLRGNRPYKSGLSHEKALTVLLIGDERSKPEYFDPKALQAFREIRDQFNNVYEVFKD